MSEQNLRDRRRFLLNVLRGGAAAVLLGGTGLLAGRQGRPCVNNQACRGCGQYEGCDLPAAQASKDAAAARRQA